MSCLVLHTSQLRKNQKIKKDVIGYGPVDYRNITQVKVSSITPGVSANSIWGLDEVQEFTISKCLLSLIIKISIMVRLLPT